MAEIRQVGDPIEEVADTRVVLPRSEFAFRHLHEAVLQLDADEAAVRDVFSCLNHRRRVFEDILDEYVCIVRVGPHVEDLAAAVAEAAEREHRVRVLLRVRDRLYRDQVLGHEQSVRLYEEASACLILGHDFLDSKHGRADVGIRYPRERVLRVEVETGVFLDEFDASVMTPQ